MADYSKKSSSSDTSTTSQLLFINKDPSNLSRTAAEIYAVGSYVSKGSRKWRRPKSSLALDSSTGRILAAAGVDSSAVSKTPSPTLSKPINLKWRLENSKIAASKPIESCMFPASKKAKQVKSATTSPSPPMSATPTAPPQPPTDQNHGQTIISLLSLYSQTIRPFARSVSSNWIWIDDISLIQGSPALTYALCAFASAFQQGVRHGLQCLALPPAVTEDETPLWYTPPWFAFQAQAISLLRRHLADVGDSDRVIQKAELHAILFLMRLSVMLGDRRTALLHLEAIKKATQNAAILPDLHVDISMWKVNFILAFRHQSSITVQPYVRSDNPSLQAPFIDFDPLKVSSSTEWQKLNAITLDRTLLWRTQEPQIIDLGQDYLVDDFLEADSNVDILGDNVHQHVKVCLKISRYLLAYLRYNNADTSSDRIRAFTARLRSSLSSLQQTDGLWRHIPRLMLYICYAGSFASLGQPGDRNYFVRLLYTGLSSIGDMTTNLSRERTINAAKELLANFIDPRTTNASLTQEIWYEVAAARDIIG